MFPDAELFLKWTTHSEVGEGELEGREGQRESPSNGRESHWEWLVVQGLQELNMLSLPEGSCLLEQEKEHNSLKCEGDGHPGADQVVSRL
jgi:hypothetical protein